MRKIQVFFLLIVIGSLLSCAPALSKKEAATIVRQYMGYPKPLMGIVTAGPAGGPAIKQFMKGIHKLEAEGYVSGQPSKSPSGKSYHPTEKSRDYMVGIYIKESYPLYEGAVCREVLKSIEDIEYTRGHDAATVTFTSGLEPIEPVYSLLCINKYCDCFGKDFKETQTVKLKLHRYEKGWLIGG
ncbi:MAG: hypothetical protein P8013_07460 [Candidatus Sulfobium sp.]|jgi:hypothetical protein